MEEFMVWTRGVFIVFWWKNRTAFWVETWRTGLERQGKNISSYRFLFFVQGMKHSIFLISELKRIKLLVDSPRLQTLKNSTRLEKVIKKLKSLACALYWWRSLQRALMWLGVAIQGWPLPVEWLWQWQVLFKESRYFLEGTNFYKLTAVYLGNVTIIGLAE